MFLDTLGEACQKTGWQVHAYCLMPNHFQLVVETPAANLVPGMKWFMGAYTMRFNRRHGLSGHLFHGRYKSLFVEGGGGAGCLKTVCDYTHLNPALSKLLAPKEKLSRYGWSSYPAYLLPARERPAWLRTDRLLKEHGLRGDTPATRRQFELLMEARRVADLDHEWKRVRRGWYLGGPEFRKGLLKKMRAFTGSKKGGEALRESEKAWAEELLAEELKLRRWKPPELARRRKGDAEKVKIARRLRRETTMTLAWIAARLNMGETSSLANLLGRASKKQ